MIQQTDANGTLTATFLITENPAGSTVRYNVDVQAKGLFKLAARAAGKLLEHLGPKVLAEIKDELEGRR